MALEPDSTESFGLLFRRFLHEVVEAAPAPEETPFRSLLQDHLGADPTTLPLVSETFGSWDHANVQVALDAWLEAPGRTAEAIGVLGGGKRHMAISLSDLVAGEGPTFRPGPVDRVNLAVGPGRTRSCLDFAVLLLRGPDGVAVLLLHGGSEFHGPTPRVTVEVMAPTDEAAVAVLAELRRLMAERNIYRGQVVSLGGGPFGDGNALVTFHARADVPRDGIVLADGVLERVERHVLGVAAHRERLLRAGRHLKRGLLLHGPPGTGKTLTVTYLIGRMQDATVLILSGSGMGMIGPSCAMARALEPSLVVLEDVDLVAEERTMYGGGNPLLFQLLNEMDGIAGDADVAFVLTTNRADLLEPALAARPGRVDQAIDIEPPDAEGRRRLLELYGAGLDLRVTDVGRVVERTAGVSPAFIKELLRKAALAAVEDDGDAEAAVLVEDRHLHAALDELLAEGSVLTRVLLGGASDRSQSADDGAPDRPAWAGGWSPLPGADLG